MTELDKRELVELIRGVVNPGFESVNQRIDGLEQRMGGMEQRMDGMAGDIRKLQLDNENVIKPQIQKIAEGHMQLAEKMDRMQDELSAVHEEVTAVSLAFGYHQQQAQGYQR